MIAPLVSRRSRARHATSTTSPARRSKWWYAGAALALGVTAAVYRSCSERQEGGFRLNLPSAPEPEAFSGALFQSVGTWLGPGHEIEVLENGAVFDALERSIRQAHSSVHVLMYIWAPGAASRRISNALIERAQSGVECRVLVDAFGSSKFDDATSAQLSQAGCEVRLFRPTLVHDGVARNHRKIVVIDGEVAFTGGFGIRDNWLGNGLKDDEWRDTHVRFRGPAVLDAQQAFAENWQEAGGTLLPSTAFPRPETTRGSAEAAFVSSTESKIVTRAERLTQLTIGFARQRIWIENAYFVPSPAILELLERKAAEGVDVRILVAGKKSDSKTSFGAQQFEYRDLLKRGVRVWEYQPGMMHAKSMLVDSELSLIGSINLDPLSLNELEEGALVTRDPGVNQRLARDFLEDTRHARELAP